MATAADTSLGRRDGFPSAALPQALEQLDLAGVIGIVSQEAGDEIAKGPLLSLRRTSMESGFREGTECCGKGLIFRLQ